MLFALYAFPLYETSQIQSMFSFRPSVEIVPIMHLCLSFTGYQVLDSIVTADASVVNHMTITI